MRILTPTEQRETEKWKRNIADINGKNATRTTITITLKNREFWLNILDMALQQQESMRDAWRKNKAPNFTDEVADKLRPNE